MAKRKLGASVIILCIAAITLISGTYAWFLVGGFANLFDIGFDVIESTGGLLLKGDAGTAEKGAKEWGTKLEREDFKICSFIVEGGKYKPVSSADATKFLQVDLKNDEFTYSGEAPLKADDTNPNDIVYNNFTFRIKSDADEIVGNIADEKGAYIQIDLNGDKKKKNDDGTEEFVTPEGDERAKDGAAVAARVAVTFDDVTTIYSTDGEDYKAITTGFSGQIIDTHNKDSGKKDASGNTIYEGDRIITDADTNSVNAALKAPESPVVYKTLRKENADGTKEAIKIYLGNIPNLDSQGKEVTVKIWLEGNDKDCVDFADNTIAGKSLRSNISFGITE